MIKPDRILRDVLYAWPVKEAGLPARLVHAADRHGIATLNELRRLSEDDLLALRNIGHLTVQQLHHYLAQCETLIRGKLTFRGVREVLHSFLNDDEYEVLYARYGLGQHQRTPSRRCVTFDAIGKESGRTRERIRQVERNALLRFGSRWAQAVLEPLARHFERLLDLSGGYAPFDEVRRRLPPEALDTLDACGLLLLLSDTQRERFSYRHLAFFRCSQEALGRVEQRLKKVLEAQTRPMALEPLKKTVVLPPAVDASCLPLLLASIPGVVATRDDRTFLFSRGIHAFLDETLEALPEEGMSLSRVTRRLNRLLAPSSRKGERTVQKALSSHPSFLVEEKGLVRRRTRA